MPHAPPLLKELLIILVASVPIAFASHRLRLPTIVGFMITGIVIGPSGFGLVRDVDSVEALAEIGIVLLLFSLGLEFSLRHILEIRRLVFLGGGMQILLGILAAIAIVVPWGGSVHKAIFYGFLFSLSSTAIVLKSYMDRAEIDTPHGRAGLGVLLFQDLCVVPMMLLVPILSGREGSSAAAVALSLGFALVTVAAVLFAARIAIPRMLYQIVRLRSREIFSIFAVLVSLGTAWLTSQLGLSLALGAFIGGLVLSESEYSHQIVADILPLRDVFNSIFFISIGMLLSVSSLANQVPSVTGWFACLLVGKTIVLSLVMLLLGYPLRIALMIGIGLSQVGEFSFILAKAGLEQNLFSNLEYQKFLATSILSMIATPFLIQNAPRAAYAIQALIAPQVSDEPGPLSDAERLRGHTVIVGYGLNGRNLARVLRGVKIRYVVVELNPETVREGTAAGEPILYGDSTRHEMLRRAGVDHARILVLAISDPVATRHTVGLAREMNPDLHIIVRTRYMIELPDLYALGANQVIPEEFETSIEIFARVLREYGIARNIIQQQVEEIRREGYQMLRTPSVGLIEVSELSDALGAASTETLFIPADHPVVGATLGQLNLRKATGATVIAAVHNGVVGINPGPDFKFSADDIVVLLGSPEQIEAAIEHLLKAPQVRGSGM